MKGQTATRRSLLSLDPFPAPSADHSRCWRDENCGAADCPPAAAERRRQQAQAGAWSKLTPPRNDGDAYGSYHHLDGRPISCGSRLELQKLVYEGDDYGEYTRLLQEGQSVRFELDYMTPVLYVSIGGHEATIRYHEWLRFRWPAGGA